jgi:hypothetical protein
MGEGRVCVQNTSNSFMLVPLTSFQRGASRQVQVINKIMQYMEVPLRESTVELLHRFNSGGKLW